jgi:ATP-binding cassette subfamily F protein 2
MAPKAKKGMTAAAKKRAEAKAAPSKRAAEAKKSEMLHGDGQGRLAVLDALHVTGVLASRPQSRDVRIDHLTLSLHGKELIQDTTLQINYGRRYGLIGMNGSGKTSLLAAIACRELPIPDHVDMWFVHQEAEPTEITALQAVVDIGAKEYQRLEDLTTKLMEEDAEGNMDLIELIGDKLDRMSPETFEARAGELLFGLGFSNEMMRKSTKDMSGGWRMRVSLAQALFQQPTLLILDEPTNHLDLGACVWLEEYLAQYPSTVILTSHSEDFLNGVCTETMQITLDGTLVYWGGNYDAYIKTRQEKEVNDMKAYEKEQADIAHLKDFIRSCGTYANLRKQADSKQKIIDKMIEKGLTEKPKPDPQYQFTFPQCETLAPPVLAFHDVSFSYSGRKEDYLYDNISFGVDQDSRIALVGPNGAGKSTLLKLMRGELQPVEGEVKRHGHLRLGVYNQHSAEVLPGDKSPLQFMMEKYGEGITTTSGTVKMEQQEWRAKLGCYGVRQEKQLLPIETMSDGLKSRVVFTLISLSNPHILLLDEPTNHLDMQCIDALAEAINKFNGGLVLVSHDFRLIGQVAKEIWVAENRTLTPWKKSIADYKIHLSKQQKKAALARKK